MLSGSLKPSFGLRYFIPKAVRMAPIVISHASSSIFHQPLVTFNSMTGNVSTARNSCVALLKQGIPLKGVCTAASADYVETASLNGIDAIDAGKETRVSLACPVCYEPLNLLSSGVLFKECSPKTELKCSGCKRSYYGKESHLDLTLSSGGTLTSEPVPPITELFRIPLVSFAYERGWRQLFATGGYPGPEKEFEMMKEYLKPVEGGNIVDASCGSGLFARIFAKSEMFSLVVALDFSETMLQQCYEFFKQDDAISKENIMLTRSDIVRLPFMSRSIDAVHAGAAIHCWPSPTSSVKDSSSGSSLIWILSYYFLCGLFQVAEICRVLKPGGVFVGTTSVLDGPIRFLPLLGSLRQDFARTFGSYVFLDTREIEDICRTCGLVDFAYQRNGQFILFSAKKPA